MRFWVYIALLLSNIGYSQYCGTSTSNILITPTTTSQLTASYSSGRRAFNFVATAGCVYEFSTCSQTTGDSYLRLYSTGTGGTLLAQNDNFCGTQSTLTWTATVNGTVSVLLTRASCNALNVATRMSYKRISCSVPLCTTPVLPMNGSIGANINQTLSWNAISIATNYDVYFGTNSSPPLVTTQTSTNYNPGTLNYSTTYYWKVIPKNSNGSSLGCSTWSFTTKQPGCLTATYGQFPTAIYNPGCSGTVENITTTGYASEYSLVTLISNVTYTLSSSNSTDFITISNDNGTTVLAYGTNSVVYSCTTDGNYRFYTHTNQLCGSSTTSRSRRIQCSTPPPPSNDFADNAIDMGICGGVINGNTKFATNVGDGPNCYTGGNEIWTAPGVWYKLKGNGQNINLSLCGSAYDTKLFVYTGTETNLTCLTYNDDFCSTQSSLNFASVNDSVYHILVTGYGSSKGAFTLSVTITPSPPIITTQPQANTICVGQSHTFSVMATGNQLPLSYQWYLNNTIISGAISITYSTVIPGNYHVKVTNSCGSIVQSNSVNLEVQSPPNLSTSVSNITCSEGGNGSIDLVVSGAGNPFTFNWSGPNGFTSTSEDLTNLATGIYTVVVTNFIGCSSTTTIPVSEPSSLVLTLIGSDALCVSESSGSIDLTVSGGTPGYNYLWSNGSTNEDLFNLSDGVYTINVTDNNNCIATASVTISDPAPFIISVNSPTITTCQTSPIQLVVSSNQPISTYLWSNGSTTNTISVLPTTTTVYTIQAWSQNSCYAITQSTVTVNQSVPLPLVGHLNGPNQAYPYMISGGVATYSVAPVLGESSYNWYIPNDGVFFTSSSNSNVITVQITPDFVGGEFYVMVSNGCDSNFSDTLTVDILQDPIIVGSSCGVPLGSLITQYISNSLPGLTYTWTKPYGATIVTGQGNDTIKIKYSTTWFNSTTSSNLVASIITPYGTFTGTKPIIRNPSSPIVINGPTVVCADNSTIYEYYVDSVSNATGYIWGLPATVILVDGQLNDTIHVKFNTTYINGNFNVQSLNQCGSSAMTYGYAQNVNVPLTPGVISGPTDVCPFIGSTATFSVVNQIGYTYYWTPPSGVTVVSGQGTNIVQLSVPFGFTSGTINVKMNNGCGYSNISTFNMTTVQQSIVVSPISGLTNPCTIVGTNQTTPYSITPLVGVTYNWLVPADMQIVSGQGTNSIEAKFLSGFSGGTASLVVTPNCGNPAMTTKNISPVYPAMNLMGTTCIENGQNYNYYINLSNVSSYNIQSWNWVVPTGAVITSGQGTSSIIVSYPVNFESNCLNNLCDSIKCFIQFPCGTKMMAKRIGMTTYPVATITGPVSTCGPDTIQLSASSSNRATIYYWGNVNGTTFISINGIPTIPSQSQTVNSKINTTFLGSSYNVQAINQCGSTAMRYFYVAKDCTVPFIVNTTNETSTSVTTIDDIMTSLEYIESINKPLDFITFPNPGKDFINLRVFKGTSDYYLITINNIIGEVVYYSLHESNDILDVSKLNKGVFFMQIESKEGYKLTKEIIIEK